MPESSDVLRGSCLCGGVRFEVARLVGPFELCHCTRCRKASGAAFVAGLRVAAEGFRLLEGQELVRSYEAPILRRPPAYRTSFCGRCGGPVPTPRAGEASFEVPAGCLDEDPGCRPDRHIFVDHGAGWDEMPASPPTPPRPRPLRPEPPRLPRPPPVSPPTPTPPPSPPRMPGPGRGPVEPAPLSGVTLETPFRDENGLSLFRRRSPEPSAPMPRLPPLRPAVVLPRRRHLERSASMDCAAHLQQVAELSRSLSWT